MKPPLVNGRNRRQQIRRSQADIQHHYDEGLKVGYKWYDAEKKPVLFPFGHGLPTQPIVFRIEGRRQGKSVTFTVKNTGERAGTEIAEVYAALPASAGEPPKRLVGWARVALKPGESREVTVAVDPKYLSIYDEQQGWKLVPGQYTFLVGGSSQDLPLKQETTLN